MPTASSYPPELGPHSCRINNQGRVDFPLKLRAVLYWKTIPFPRAASERGQTQRGEAQVQRPHGPGTFTGWVRIQFLVVIRTTVNSIETQENKLHSRWSEGPCDFLSEFSVPQSIPSVLSIIEYSYPSNSAPRARCRGISENSGQSNLIFEQNLSRNLIRLRTPENSL